MKLERRKVFKCVHCQDGQEFQREMQAVLDSAGNPKITYPPGLFVAYIEYTETVEIPETISEEYEASGATRYCRECPYLETNGDRRRKRFPCKYANYGIAYMDSPCCDRFYQDLERGVIRLED